MKSTNTIEWFRHASPYINSHRGKTFVLCFSGAALTSDFFTDLINDITLLSHLGVRLVLVHGLRAQLDSTLEQQGIEPRVIDGLRVTDDKTRDALIAEVGAARVFIESRLSMGLPNTPMAGAHLSVASGNFITARPHGIHHGVDFLHTGQVRQVHATAIEDLIQRGHLVLLPPLGYSRTGDVFNLLSEEVAMQTAISLNAEKLIYMTEHAMLDSANTPIREADPDAIVTMTDNLPLESASRLILTKAATACKKGVKRAHILSLQDRDALLKELFTRDGSGTMINADQYELSRMATISDIGGIATLIKPLEADGTLVPRSMEQLELDIEYFRVIEREGLILACGALLPMPASDTEQSHDAAEIACLVTHPDYQNTGRARSLLAELEQQASRQGIKTLYVLTTRTNHWFLEQGFKPAELNDLPATRLTSVNRQRNSRVLSRQLPKSH